MELEMIQLTNAQNFGFKIKNKNLGKFEINNNLKLLMVVHFTQEQIKYQQ